MKKKISQIRSSGVTTITKSAEIANLQRQNELLKTQKGYQQELLRYESLQAAESAKVALGISNGYAANGSSSDGLFNDGKVSKFAQFGRAVFQIHENDITQAEYTMRAAEDYMVAQKDEKKP